MIIVKHNNSKGYAFCTVCCTVTCITYQDVMNQDVSNTVHHGNCPDNPEHRRNVLSREEKVIDELWEKNNS